MLGPLDALDEKYGTKSCLNKMAVLHALVSKPSSANRVWCWQTMYHMILKGQLANEGVTKKFLLGGQHSPGNIGVWELKALVLEHLLSCLLAKAKLVDKDLVVLRSALSNHASYRAHMLEGDRGWQGQLSPSSVEALLFVEARLFELSIQSDCNLLYSRHMLFDSDVLCCHSASQKLIYSNPETTRM